MKNKYSIFKLTVFGLVLFCACTQIQKKSDYILIISSWNKKNDSIERPPNPEAYHHFNFIIDSTGQLYYYQLEHVHLSSCIVDTNESPKVPEFIDLKPKDLIQIPENNISDFVKLNILNNKIGRRMISIASVQDTIKSNGLKILLHTIDSTRHWGYNIRLVTPEEKIVLSYKQRQDHYDPNYISWDSTKTLFTKY
jgi:hypothetical protein